MILNKSNIKKSEFIMEGTPIIQRKASSLSLSTRLNKKRLSASPQQSHFKTSTSKILKNANEINSNSEAMQRSCSVISICSDGGIECTPPRKKKALNLDESFDFSPKTFDSSFSPTCLLSQTLAIDSPEVGWKWSRHSDKNVDSKCGIETSSIRTPDSAYAADSSFASAGSSSNEVAGNARIRGNSYKKHGVNDARREDQRKIIEQELRRVENTRAEEMLKQRCAKLQEQLKSAGTQNVKTSSQSKEESLKKNAIIVSNSSSVEMKSQSTPSATEVAKTKLPEKTENSELLNDFFDDSDMDCFLLQATQEIESKIEAKPQSDCGSIAKKLSISSELSSKPDVSSAPVAATIAASNENDASMNADNNDKRSSFYMKFFDDCPDDWFTSLDEVILQATQNKKPRTSLQRYKSMPTETAVSSKSLLMKNDKNDNCVVSKKSSLEESAASSSPFSKMKRHSSTHALSPVGPHCKW